MTEPQNLKQLIKQGYLYPVWLAEKNDFLLNEKGKREREKIIKKEYTSNLPRDLIYLDLNKLETLEGYFAFLTREDYSALSPIMWNTLFEKKRLNLKTLFFVGNPEYAEVVVGAFRTDPKFLGGGFGSGWKEQYNYLDRVYPNDLSAVNNIARDSKTRELVGYNTDIAGFLLPLEDKFKDIGKENLEGKTIVMFGAGGVGKEIPMGLLRKGISRLYLINRTVSKVESLAKELNKKRKGFAEYGGEDKTEEFLLKEDIDAVINTTKKGAEPLQDYSAFAPVDIEDPNGIQENNKKSLEIAKKLYKQNPDIVIYDITLPKGVPKTLEIAEQAGLKNLVHGKNMVINQGIIAIKNIEKLNPGVFGEDLKEEEIKKIFSKVAL